MLTLRVKMAPDTALDMAAGTGKSVAPGKSRV
jgi:hypothetical protein